MRLWGCIECDCRRRKIRLMAQSLPCLRIVGVVWKSERFLNLRGGTVGIATL